MKKTKKLFSIIVTLCLFFTTNIFSSPFFTGYTGAKLNYSANKDVQEYDPDLKLQAFFAGQFNFTQNFWSHLEFSIDTQDILSDTIFNKIDSAFQIDEISITARGNLSSAHNYFSIYMGAFEPIGSDIFLQRYFTITPIASKIADSYLGLAGSLLYPHFGIGISDIIRFYDSPVAFGGYLYVNHEDAKFYVLNADLRFACNFRYFTCDFAAGIGTPLANKYNGQDVLLAIEKIYWHAGTTLLFGNNYTTSLFIQAGINNASFSANSNKSSFTVKDLYLLFEPRFYMQGSHLNITLFSLPPKTVDSLLFVDDSLGIDLNLYSDSLLFGNKTVTLGSHLSFSLINKSILSFGDINNIFSNGYNINITPYFSTQLLSGEIHVQTNIRIMDFAREQGFKAVSVDIGYRTRF